MKHLNLNTTQWLELGKKMGYLDKVSQVSNQPMGAEQATAPIAPTPKGAETDDILRIVKEIKAVQSKLVSTHNTKKRADGILVKYIAQGESLIKQKAIEERKKGQEAVVAELQLSIEKNWARINELKGIIASLKQNYNTLMTQYGELQKQLKQLQQ